MTDHVEEARAALDRGDALHAYDLLRELGDHDAESFELLAVAAYGAGEFEAAVHAWERLHEWQVGRGDVLGAAQAAAMIAMYLMMDTGLMAPVRGWLRTAERLLDGTERTAAHAMVAMTRTYERFMCGDMDAAREQSALAIELGTETGVTPAVVIGRTAAARVRIFEGDLAGGLGQLDEVGALLMSGGADPLTTGMMYCELVCAAQGLGLHDMASEWTDVMDTWRHGVAFGGINGRCRVHRAEILRVSGPCDEAEAEALGACDELRPWMRREFGWPLAELGTIRLRRGDLAGAEEALLEAHQHAWSPQPGLALLRLAQGDVDAAAAMIDDAIAHPFDIPSKERPPFGDLRLAPVLDAQAEIAYVRRDSPTVRAAHERLSSIVERYPGPFLQAWTDLAAARAAVLDGDPDTAIGRCQSALASWIEQGAPYEAATTRLVLADAYGLALRHDAARLERQAAAAGFAGYGASLRAEEADRLAGQATASTRAGADPETAPAPPPPAPVVRFERDGANRHVEFDGNVATLRDLKGFRYVERLVAEPRREFHVLDLVAAEEGVIRPGSPPDPVLRSRREIDTGLPVLDDEAREAYRRRLGEIDRDIEDARQMNDPARAELAERDREYLIAELSRAVGLGGSRREVGATAERARTAVTRSIRYALGQLDTSHPELTGRLRRGIRTGAYCSYEPDPMQPLTWTLGS